MGLQTVKGACAPEHQQPEPPWVATRSHIPSVGSERMKRREFINKCGQLGIGLAGLTALAGCSRNQPPGATPRQVPSVTGEQAQREAPPPDAGLKIGNNRWQAGPEDVDVVVAKNMKPAELVQAGLDRYGGISSWVHSGDVVAIKPNLAWARQPAQAATTSPEVLAAVIGICRQAHPKRIIVVEHSCDTSTVAFDISGAKQLCEELSVPLISLSHENMYQQVSLPAGRNIHTDQVATDILECDVYINLPIVKAHSATGATIALKNQMGVVWDQGAYHRVGSGSARGLNLHQNIAGLAASLRPTLNIVDATRMLVTGGPQGPGKVVEHNTVLVSADMVAIDTYAARLLGYQPQDIPHIGLAAAAGVGESDLSAIKVAVA